MEDTNTLPPNSVQSTTQTEQMASIQLLSNYTTMRSGDRTYTHKLAIAGSEKYEIINGNHGAVFCQNLRMTKD